MKKICLTYDYELFFKESGTIENCILKPTYSTLDILNRNNQVANFFIDVLFLIRLKEVELECDNLRKIIDQLQFMVKNGHRIELHLHPHWLDAEYKDGKWIFPHYDHYRLNSLPISTITNLFVSGTQFLEEIAREVISDYKVKAFRAGGWSIQPFHKLKEGFIKAGIEIDSSVAPGLKEKGDRFYDFLNAPKKESWRFSDDPLEEDINGSFLEIPIQVYKKTFKDRLNKYIYHKCTNDVIFGDGKGLLGAPVKFSFKKIKNKFKSTISMLTSDSVSAKELTSAIDKSFMDTVIIINHPKSMLKKRGIDSLNKLKKYESVLLINIIND
jgi:hypothetical protein